ncbi:glycosyl hydrolase [Joostella sp.]|uniref:glycosyl hydrolase n=1 Tax=Joostella sp. TaxID=2231138 RepID=UPI003A8DFF42
MTLVDLKAQNASIEQHFQNPPSSAKPLTIWFWINGSITKEGITADLEAMKNVGIQGALIFNVSLGNPPGSAIYLSTEWLNLFNYAAIEAKRLGLELGFHNGAGWSSSGGPVITPEYAMQEVTFSETVLQGGQEYRGKLKQPKTKLGYYKDIVTLAFPKPKNDIRIKDLDIKTISHKVRNHLTPTERNVSDLAIVKKSDIIDLTSKLTNDGSLQWYVPEGEWVVLRLGHTPTGEMNRFPSDGGLGLECDKMSKQAVDIFWEGGIIPIVKKLDTLIGTTVKRCHIDSYEVGTTNWTGNFASEFSELREYDCELYLPTLAGYYVESGEETERFLWDFRRTIGDLIAENYYGRFKELSHQYGMLFSAEPYWGPFDNMQVGENTDIVMSEFWSGSLAFFDSPKFVASIAKLNGSPIAEAESFTGIGGWDQHPGKLKAIGDLAWAQGINRFVFHCYVHQPWNIGPGLTLQAFGTDFNRLNTWWNQGKYFVDYISRGQVLLQQGKSVADVLVFTGESSPNDALLMPEIKAMGYDYDLIGTNKIYELSVSEGLICTPTGNKYSALVLPKSQWMTPETLEVIQNLVNKGALVLGDKPRKSPSLKNYPESDYYIQEIANKLWSTGQIKNTSIIDVLKNNTMSPDFSVEKENGELIDYIHRKTENTDIYFVVNSKKESRVLDCRFRVSGKQPELWNAETGEIEKAAVWHENGDNTTTVSIPFKSEGSVFVVFRHPVHSNKHILHTEITLKEGIKKPLSDLKVIKAQYGMFLPDGLVDVTEALKKYIRNNRLKVQATRELSIGDPAPGYKKELRVLYKIGKDTLEKNAMEREWLDIDPSKDKKLEIIKAVFGKFQRGLAGIPPNNPIYDITDKIKELVASGTFEIPVSNSIVPGNLTPSKYTLRIVYCTNGQEKITTATDGEIIKLTQPTPKSKLIYEDEKVKWVTPVAGEITYRSSSGKTNLLKVKSVPQPIELSSDWEVNFPLINNTPIDTTFNELISWTNVMEKDIQYFSGTARYTKQFNIPNELIKSENSLQLDLGDVKEIAEVYLNGIKLGVLWKAPFRFNIDDAVVEGTNTLEIKVTNLWPNRLIGDEQLPADYTHKGPIVNEWPDWLVNKTKRPTERISFVAFKHWKKDSKLLPSGLLGPVRIVISKVAILN